MSTSTDRTSRRDTSGLGDIRRLADSF
jgi:site-specific recombinase XerD